MNKLIELFDVKGFNQSMLAKKIGKSFLIEYTYIQNWRPNNIISFNKISESLNVDSRKLLNEK